MADYCSTVFDFFFFLMNWLILKYVKIETRQWVYYENRDTENLRHWRTKKQRSVGGTWTHDVSIYKILSVALLLILLLQLHLLLSQYCYILLCCPLVSESLTLFILTIFTTIIPFLLSPHPIILYCLLVLTSFILLYVKVYFIYVTLTFIWLLKLLLKTAILIIWILLIKLDLFDH